MKCGEAKKSCAVLLRMRRVVYRRFVRRVAIRLRDFKPTSGAQVRPLASSHDETANP